MADEPKQGAAGTNGDGATDGTNAPVKEPDEGSSINSKAKELPWVRELMKSKAELDRLKSAQAEATSKAEREKAESEGRYKDALAMEQKKAADIEVKYRAETKSLALKTELVTAGFRPQAVRLFLDDFNPDETSAEEFAAKLKADEKNAWLLVDAQTQQRSPKDPPPAAGIGKGQTVDPSWIHSPDPEKRKAAIEHNRKTFWASRGDSK